MQDLQSFILIKHEKAKINLKNKPQHLDKQVHNIFRLQSLRHPASYSEFALPEQLHRAHRAVVAALGSQGLSLQRKKTLQLTAQHISNLWETFGKVLLSWLITLHKIFTVLSLRQSKHFQNQNIRKGERDKAVGNNLVAFRSTAVVLS